MKWISTLCLIIIPMAALAVTNDSPYLYGIHWYGNPDEGDVESMTGGKGIWVLEITLVDTSQANPWDWPSFYVTHCQKITAKNHSVIFRIQPNWGRNVPHSEDPYTLPQYADDCKAAANTLRDYCHIWQIGNEVNLNGENNRWGGSSYNVPWEPTPAQYSETYIACRDKIHEITPNTNPPTQIVLMQPVSPGNVIPGVRYMDGNEFLWRQIEAVTDKSKIDGFALHGYAEPGGTNFGLDGFWDSIREQLMVIDQWGLGNRPVYITEWNKHMPDDPNARIGAKFLHRTFTFMNNWNTGSGGEWPGLSNHNVVAATWFVYPSGYGWDAYSLKYWKTISPTDQENNPWYSFNYACGLNYLKGASGGGPTVPANTLWWRDTFDGATLDTNPPLPDWKAETTGGGSVVMSGTGSVRLLGNGTQFGGGGIRTAGYVYGNFHLETDITITNAARSSTLVNEANFDLRLREGSKGYSLTFFTSGSPTNTNRIVLRRTNDWVQIGGYNVLVPGGINSGDSFKIFVIANGSNIAIRVYKIGTTTPVVDWNITDDEQKVGWIRLMSYNLEEARVNDFQLGGPQWSSVLDWNLY